MFKYIVKRLLISLLVLFGVSIIIYTLVRLMPNDYIDLKYASQIQQGQITQEDVDRFKELYGIGDKTFKGLVNGYVKWLGNVCRGNLGISFKYNKPVSTVIISSATHQYSMRDYLVTIFTMIGISLPTYFFGAIVIKIFSVNLGWFPSNGLISAGVNYPDTFAGGLSKLGDMIYHLVLPIFVSVILSIGGLMRYTRTNTLEVLGADYIRTARAKGLSENKVIYRHAFRNTMIPLVTLLAGILITEQVFGIPGIGNLAYKALKEGDIPFVMGYNMFLAVLTVIGTLLSDLMYSVVDPRVKLGK